MEKVRRTAALYYLLQGLGVIAWWILLVAYPESRGWFQLEANSQLSLFAFWLPDALLIAAGSLITAYLTFSRNRFESAATWLLTGAVSYAMFYTLAFAMMTDRGWLGVVLMMPSMLWTGLFATALTVGNGMFRQARATSTNYVLVKTFAQIVVVWGIILVAIPYLITLIEDRLGVTRLEFAYQRPIAAVIFIAVSSIGVYAAIVMSRIGKGTPLPLDHASELVVAGPYRYVRNPMAVSGIGQGLAVALFLGSPFVAAYALTGSAIWQLVFRPLEEDDLEDRFGEQFAKYRSAVKCWLPRSKPYSSAD
ncbi:MAG: isoprenylcysteine carboxylmethyltransferase family protein [Chloracidobacterium sp.]|nr:isoprenylcysteine carboxylmethyltransferase family protein [Chloracidobacterium sp.]